MTRSSESQRLQAIRDDRSAQRAKSAELRSAINALNAGIERKLGRQATLEEQLAEAQRQVSAKDGTIRTLRDRLGSLETRISELEQQAAEADRLRPKLAELEDINLEQKEEIAELQEMLETTVSALQELRAKLDEDGDTTKAVSQGGE